MNCMNKNYKVLKSYCFQVILTLYTAFIYVFIYYSSCNRYKYLNLQTNPKLFAFKSSSLDDFRTSYKVMYLLLAAAARLHFVFEWSVLIYPSLFLGHMTLQSFVCCCWAVCVLCSLQCNPGDLRALRKGMTLYHSESQLSSLPQRQEAMHVVGTQETGVQMLAENSHIKM